MPMLAKNVAPNILEPSFEPLLLNSAFNGGQNSEMCNAKSLRRNRNEIVQFAHELGVVINIRIPDFSPRYRIGPRQTHLVIRRNSSVESGAIMEPALWDFLPPNTKGKSKYLLTNARSDKLTGWPWKLVIRTGRCLVPADGFFDPEKLAGAKGTVPWAYYHLKGDGIFWLAGLFSEAVNPETGEVFTTYAIITTDANGVLRIHNRMPVMLWETQAALAWMMDETPPLELLQPAPDDIMEGYRVCNEARNSRIRDHAGMIEPVEDQQISI